MLERTQFILGNFPEKIASANGNDGVELPADQAEIIFMGTGTSEGVHRVSCLTNPLKKCPVCSKAAEPVNKNRRLNTSILIRHPNSSGIQNILIDAGKFFYQSALRWFPAFGWCGTSCEHSGRWSRNPVCLNSSSKMGQVECCSLERENFDKKLIVYPPHRCLDMFCLV